MVGATSPQGCGRRPRSPAREPDRLPPSRPGRIGHSLDCRRRERKGIAEENGYAPSARRRGPDRGRMRGTETARGRRRAAPMGPVSAFQEAKRAEREGCIQPGRLCHRECGPAAPGWRTFQLRSVSDCMGAQSQGPHSPEVWPLALPRRETGRRAGEMGARGFDGEIDRKRRMPGMRHLRLPRDSRGSTPRCVARSLKRRTHSNPSLPERRRNDSELTESPWEQLAPRYARKKLSEGE